VPYGYNITLSVNITSNEPMTIWLTRKTYNGATQDIKLLAYNTQSYQGVLTLTSNYYYYQISISPSQGATVNVDIKPIAIKPIS